MSHIELDVSKAAPFITEEELAGMTQEVLKAENTLTSHTGAGSDFTGWVDQPVLYDKVEFLRIKEAAARMRSNSDAIIILGVGGSYLGARAVVESLKPHFYNSASIQNRHQKEIYFAGNSFSPLYLSDLIKLVEDKDLSINVISKSGTTTETAIAFRIFKEIMEKKYGKEESKKRIFVTTDRHKGSMKAMADREGYETFVVPDNIGGRYSVESAVGLLPIACAGINIDEFMEGNAAQRDHLLSKPFEENEALIYAAYRNIFYRQGKCVELLANYEPNLNFISEWWKQLYGESEGKDGKGIFPASTSFSTDLHSLGQYIQDGPRILFETVMNVEKPARDIKIQFEEDDFDGLNYLAGKTVDFVNKNAMAGTLKAHVEGKVPNMILNLKELSPYYIGALMYFFEFACGVSGYVNEVNPFNQPGVESYKRNMFELLGKPGYVK